MTLYVWNTGNSNWENPANWTPASGPPTLSNGDTAQVDSSVTIGGTGSAEELDTTNQSGLVTLAGLFNIGTIFNGAAMALTGNITSSFIETFVDLSLTGTVSAIGDPSATHEGIAQYNGTVDINNGGSVDTSYYLIAYNPGSLAQPNENTVTIDGANGGASLDIATFATVNASDQTVGGFAITVAASVTVENTATLSTTYLSLEDPGAIMTVATADVAVLQTATIASADGGIAGTSIQGGTLEVENTGNFFSTYLFQGADAESAFIVDNATATIAAQADAINGLDIHDGSVFFRNGSTVSASQLFLGIPTDPLGDIGPNLTITSSSLDVTGTEEVPGFSFSAIWLADGSTEIGKGSHVTTPGLEVDSPDVNGATAPGNVVTIDGGSTVTVANDVLIGVTDGSFSQVDVDGAATQLLFGGTATLGSGTGTPTGARAQLFVTNGALVGVGDAVGAIGDLVAGANTGDQGYVEVRDADSKLSVVDATIGGSGSGTLNVHGGGSIDIGGTLVLGSSATGDGLLGLAALDGAGEVTVDTLSVGDAGKGEVFFTSSDTTIAGTLTVTNTAYVGAFAGSFGTIDATNGSLSVGGDFFVGDDGSGSVTLDSTTVDIGGDLIIGNGGPSAFVALQDVPLTLGGELDVGEAGFGALDWGSTDTQSTTVDGVVIGDQAGSDGQFVLHDPTTFLTIGTLVAGNSGNGTLDVFNAASIEVTGDAGIAVADGSTGTIDLRAGEGFSSTPYPNAGSNIVFDQTLVVGDAGDGSLSIGGDTLQSDGADAEVKGDLVIGNQDSAFGTVVVQNFFTPPGSSAVSSQLTVGGNIFVGAAATGKDDGLGGFFDGGVLQLLNTGVVDATANGAGLIDVAVSANSSGSVDVDSGTMNANTLVVGDGGDGILTIGNLGNVFVNNDVIVGNGADSTGTIDIDGTGATLQASDNMVIGGAATAIVNGTSITYPAVLDATNGATVENDGTGTNGFIVGADAHSLGEAIIDGSTLDVTLADIGLDGSGVLTIENGSTATFNDDLILGGGTAAFGGMDVNASNIDFFGAFDVGEVATGATISGTFIAGGLLTIENGATVLDQGSDGIDIGIAAGATGQMTVDNSDVEITSIVVGDEGAGTLTIQNGASLVVDPDQAVEIANAPSASGTVTVDGALLSFGSELDVGVGGNGSLSLLNGAVANPDATATNSDIVIGDDATATGTVTVDNSLLDPTDITIGNFGTGALTIQNGGTVITTGDAVIASETSSSGTATLNGLGGTVGDTLWTVDGQLTVGALGNGSLSLNNGATVAAGGEFDVGGSNDGLGSVGKGTLTATDSNTLVQSKGDLFIGADGNGTVEISLGAVLQADTGIVLGNGINAKGTLGVSQASVTNGGAVDVGVQGSGDIEVNGGGDFNAGTVNVTLATTLLGKGTLDLTNLGGGNATAETGNLSIGSVGKGTVTVHGGSQLTTNGDAIIGDTGTGGALVEGINANPTLAPSTWNITGGLSIGGTALAGGGIGTLTVANGGVVHVGGQLVMWNKGTIIDNSGTPGLIEIGGTTLTAGSGVVIDAAVAATGSTVATVQGTLAGGGTVMANIVDNGEIDLTNGQTLVIDGSISGTGTVVLDGTAVLEVTGAIASTVTIDYATGVGQTDVLELDDPLDVKGTIYNLGSTDGLDLKGVKFGGTSFDVVNDVLTVTNGGTTVAALALGGASYSASAFSLTKDGSGNAEIVFANPPPPTGLPILTLPAELPAFQTSFQEYLAGAWGIYVADPNAPINATYTVTLNVHTGTLFQLPTIVNSQTDVAGAHPMVFTGSLDEIQADLETVIWTSGGSGFAGVPAPPDTITVSLVRGDGVTETGAIGYDPPALGPKIVNSGPTTVALGQALPLTLTPSYPGAAFAGNDSLTVENLNTANNNTRGTPFSGYLMFQGGVSTSFGNVFGSNLAGVTSMLGDGNLLFVPTKTGTATVDGLLVGVNDLNGTLDQASFSFPITVTAPTRTTPITDTWTGGVSAVLSDAGNWSDVTAPGTADTAVFAPIAGVPVIATTGDGVASAWDVNTSTDFAGVVDATGASGGPAFVVDHGATANFLPGSDLFAADLVNASLPGVQFVGITGQPVIVGDTASGTLTARHMALWSSDLTIGNTAGANGSHVTLTDDSWFSTGFNTVGGGGFGVLDMVETRIDNTSAYNQNGPGFGQTQIGFNGAAGVLVSYGGSIGESTVVGFSGRGELAASGSDFAGFAVQNNSLNVNDGRADLGGGAIVLPQVGLAGSAPAAIGSNGVLAGDDWSIFNQGVSGPLFNFGTVEAAAGAGGPSTITGIQISGNGIMQIDAGATLDLNTGSDTATTVGSGQTLVFQPEFDNAGGLLNVQEPGALSGTIVGFADGDRIGIGFDNLASVAAATYDAGSNTTSVDFQIGGNGTAIAFFGSLSAGNFALDPNSPANITWFDYVQAGVKDQAPVLSSPSDIAATDGIANPIPGLSLSDADAVKNNQTLQLTLTSEFGGTFSAPAAAGLNIIGENSPTLTVSGLLPAVQSELASIGFTPVAGGSDDTLVVTATDGVSLSNSLTIQAHNSTIGGHPYTGTDNYIYNGQQTGSFDAPGAWHDAFGDPLPAGPGIADSALIDAQTLTNGGEDAIGGIGVAGQLLTEGVVVLTGTLTLAGLGLAGIGTIDGTGPSFAGALKADTGGELILAAAAKLSLGGDLIVAGEMESIADNPWFVAGNIDINGGTLRVGGLGALTVGGTVVVTGTTDASGAAVGGELDIVEPNTTLVPADAAAAATIGGGVGTSTVNVSGDWAVSGALVVGATGDGQMDIATLSGSAVASAPTVIIGQSAGAHGTLSARGGGTLTVAQTLTVGAAGDGTLDLTTEQGSGAFGPQEPGYVVVGSAASSGELDIGAASGGVGRVAIEAFGTVDVNGSAWIGGSSAGAAGGSGTLAVSGQFSSSEGFSLFEASGGLTLFNGGHALLREGTAALGSLAIMAGGTLNGDGVVEGSAGAVGVLSNPSAFSTIAPELSIVDDGLIDASVDPANGAALLTLYGSISGSGTLEIEAGATLAIEGSVASSLHVRFDGPGAQLILSQPSAFAPVIGGFVTGDSIRLPGIAPGVVTYDDTSGALTDSSGGTVYNFSFDPPFGNFAAVSDTHDGTLITFAGQNSGLSGQIALTSVAEDVPLPGSTTVATFSDTNQGDMAGTFSATIDWGDGTQTFGTVSGGAGTFAVDGGHSYSKAGNVVVGVTVSGAVTMAELQLSGTVTVNGLPLIAVPGGQVIGVGKTAAINSVVLSESGTTTGEGFAVKLTDGAGVLSASSAGGATVSAPSTTLTIGGSLNQVNAALATLSDTDGVASPDTVTINATDGFANVATAQTIAVTVNGLPMIAVPGGQIIGVGKAATISNVVLSESGTTTGESFTVKLADGAGVLSASGAGGATVSAPGKTLTISGSLGEVNAALATLSDTDGVASPDTITINATDGFTNIATTQTIAVTVNGLPMIAVPGGQVIGVGKAATISNVVLSESGTTTGESFTVKLTDGAGVLSASNAGGATVSAPGTTLTIGGSLDQVNAALATLSDTDGVASPDTITINATDGFTNVATTQTIAVTVNAAPVIAVPGGQIIGVGKAATINNVVLSESGTTSGESFAVKLTDGAGVLSASNAGGATVSAPGTTLTIGGSLNQVNAALATLSDTDGVASPDTITVNATDGFTNIAATQTIAVTVNAAPVIAVPGGQIIGVGKAATISNVVLSESGTTTGESFTVKLTDGAGVLSASSAGGATVSAPGTALTIGGSLDQVNAALATLTDTDGVASPDTVTINATDGFTNVAAAQTIAVTVNGLPMIAVPGGQIIGVGKAATINNVVLSESGTTTGESFTVKLTDGAGVLSASNAGGATVSAPGTTLTIGGSLDQVNAALATLSDTDGMASPDTITINASDGFTNIAATQTIAVTVNAAPVIAVPGAQVIAIGTAAPIGGVSVSETGNTGAPETFSVTLADTNGQLSLTASGNAKVSNNASKSVTVSGALTDVNTTLASLSDDDSSASPDTITLNANDSFGNNAVQKQIGVTMNGTGQALFLTTGVDNILGGPGNNTIVAAARTPSPGDTIDGGTGGTNTLQLTGAGIFDLRAPTTLTDIQVVIAQEGQAAYAAGSTTFPAQNQIVALRDGLDLTVRVSAGTPVAGNPKPETITIIGAHNADAIDLASGNDSVTVGDARETVNGGTGNDTIIVTAATIGANIDGGSGTSTLQVNGGGSVVMGSSVVHISQVLLASAPGSMSFIANATSGLTVNDLGIGADTVQAGGLSQTLTGGAGKETFVGFSGGGTKFLDTAAALNGDTIQNFAAANDLIDFTNVNPTSPSVHFVANSGDTAGTLTASDGTHSASVTLTGVFDPTKFHPNPDSGVGTAITYH